MCLKHVLKVSMDKTSRSFRSNRPEFESFLSEMTRWFSDHQLQVDELFRHSDADGSGSVNLKDFYLGNMSSLCSFNPKSLNKLPLLETITVLSVIYCFKRQHPWAHVENALLIFLNRLQCLSQPLWMSDKDNPEEKKEIRKRYVGHYYTNATVWLYWSIHGGYCESFPFIRLADKSSSG